MSTIVDNGVTREREFEGVRLTGTDNFRSLKGMRTQSGQRIADHTVLRSDQLHRLDDAAWEVLRTLGVKTVCDLRSLGERQRYPNHLPEAGLRQLILEVTGDISVDPRVATMLAENPTAASAENMMLEIYKLFPTMLAPHLPALFRLFEAGEVPVLIHCAAGKDRTGFVVAMLLHALGVSVADIMADYQLSARCFADLDENRQAAMSQGIFKLVKPPIDEAAMNAVLGAPPAYLQAALDSIRAQHGSIDVYLERCAGVDSAGLSRLRDRWLTPL